MPCPGRRLSASCSPAATCRQGLQLLIKLTAAGVGVRPQAVLAADGCSKAGCSSCRDAKLSLSAAMPRLCAGANGWNVQHCMQPCTGPHSSSGRHVNGLPRPAWLPVLPKTWHVGSSPSATVGASYRHALIRPTITGPRLSSPGRGPDASHAPCIASKSPSVELLHPLAERTLLLATTHVHRVRHISPCAAAMTRQATRLACDRLHIGCSCCALWMLGSSHTCVGSRISPCAKAMIRANRRDALSLKMTRRPACTNRCSRCCRLAQSSASTRSQRGWKGLAACSGDANPSRLKNAASVTRLQHGAWHTRGVTRYLVPSAVPSSPPACLQPVLTSSEVDAAGSGTCLAPQGCFSTVVLQHALESASACSSRAALQPSFLLQQCFQSWPRAASHEQRALCGRQRAPWGQCRNAGAGAGLPGSSP